MDVLHILAGDGYGYGWQQNICDGVLEKASQGFSRHVSTVTLRLIIMHISQQNNTEQRDLYS